MPLRQAPGSNLRLPQGRFRLLANPTTRDDLQQVRPLSAPKALPQRLPQPSSSVASSSSSVAGSQSSSNITTRIPKSSGLVRPTPVRHIISAATTSSSRQAAISRAAPNTSDKIIQTKSSLSPSSTTTSTSNQSGLRTRQGQLELRKINSATVRKSSSSTSSNKSTPPIAVRAPPKTNHDDPQNSSTNDRSNNPLNDSTVALLNLFASCTGDVSEIRRTLMQLLKILQQDKSHEQDLIEENSRLRQEVEQLKAIIRAQDISSDNRGYMIEDENQVTMIGARDGRSSSSQYASPLMK